MIGVRSILAIIAGALIAFLVWGTVDRFRLAEKARDQAACVRAAPTADKPLDRCAAPIANRIGEARRAAECEAALAGNELYAIRATCGAQAKRVVATRDAATLSLASARAALALADETRDAAVARAEARAITATKRTEANDRTIRAAPRADDGRVACDARCVRALAGDAAPQP